MIACVRVQLAGAVACQLLRFQVIVSIADGNRVADLDPHGFCQKANP